jgi:hypothetical protein
MKNLDEIAKKFESHWINRNIDKPLRSKDEVFLLFKGYEIMQEMKQFLSQKLPFTARFLKSPAIFFKKI